ncbi:MAG: ATP-binding protein [Chitinivibrionales bacterium]|nr:ATP-binding protein [Chitinivibrionales bacterium]
MALVGPRQVGKTTLAKTLSDVYFDLEAEEEKLRLDLQLPDILAQKKLVILDEAQNYPELFPKLKVAIDKERNRNGRFLLLGSISPSLMHNVSEFLTGRIAITHLETLSINEIGEKQSDSLWLMGGYPDGGILKKSNYPTWQTNYLDLLAMRDLPSWGLPAKPQITQRMFKMLAALHGQVWNASQLSKSLGLSYHTVNTYLDHLTQVFLVRKVQPFFTNIKKRLIKSPKVYWHDSGLVHAMSGILSKDQLFQQPWVGNSWEGWILSQILIFLNNTDIVYDGPYFLRTSDGSELDLIIIINRELWAFEIKLTSSPTREDMQKLQKTASMIKADKIVFISRTKNIIENKFLFSCNIHHLLKILAK